MVQKKRERMQSDLCGRDHENTEHTVSQGKRTWRDYAIVGDKKDPSTWQLPHHTGALSHGSQKGSGESTVDWDLIAIAVAAISRMGYRGRRVCARENEIIAAARHLAGHYRNAGKPLPNALAVLV